ncbi:MAG: hypothetical protein H7833_00435 [Magnetococcus sp. DMHC-1]
MSQDIQKNSAQPDWDQIEQEYRLGQRSIRQIGIQYNIPESSIRKKAKERGWQRDLSARTNATIRAKVLEIGVEEELPTLASMSQEERDTTVVQAAATRVKNVLEAHQKKLSRMETLIDKSIRMLEENPLDPENEPDFHLALERLSRTVVNWTKAGREAFGIDRALDEAGTDQMTAEQKKARIMILMAKLVQAEPVTIDQVNP